MIQTQSLIRSFTRLRCAGLLVWSASAAALAFQPLVTDDTGTQGAGGNQIEIELSRFVERESDNRATLRTLSVTYTRGLTDTLDMYASLAAVRFRTSAPTDAGQGAGNPAVGLKWRFYEHQDDKLSLAIKPEARPGVSRAAEADGLGAARANAGVALLVTQETSFGSLHANLAVDSNCLELPDNRNVLRSSLWRLSAAATFDIAGQWRLVADTGLMTNPRRAEEARMGYAELGLIHAPSKEVDLAVGFIRDLHHRAHKVTTVVAGATWRFR